MKTRLYASGVNWVAGSSPTGAIDVEARIRYNGKNTPAAVKALSNGAEIEFERPVRAITPGQAVVFYKGDVVLGGGLIETSLPEDGSVVGTEARNVDSSLLPPVITV